jgi:hypothetical protein
MEKTPYQGAVSYYMEWRSRKNIPLARKWNGFDGNAINGILDYMSRLAGPEKAEQAFRYILDHWEELTPFQQRMFAPQNMLRFIEEIVAKLNPHVQIGKTASEIRKVESSAYRESIAERLRKFSEVRQQGEAGNDVSDRENAQ